MKTKRQLDEEIAESLRDQQNHDLHEYVKKLSPREQELVIQLQDQTALSDILEQAGVVMKFSGRGAAGKFTISGRPTYQLRDVLKRHGFRFDGASKSWSKPIHYGKDTTNYLPLFNDLVKAL